MLQAAAERPTKSQGLGMSAVVAAVMCQAKSAIDPTLHHSHSAPEAAVVQVTLLGSGAVECCKHSRDLGLRHPKCDCCRSDLTESNMECSRVSMLATAPIKAAKLKRL